MAEKEKNIPLQLDIDISNIVYKTAKELELIDLTFYDLKLDPFINTDTVCHDIYNAIQEAYRDDLEKSLPSNLYKSIGYYCYIYGMGTAYFYLDGRSSVFKDKGIFNYISSALGLFSADKYVLSLLRINFNLKEEITTKVYSLFNQSLAASFEYIKKIYPCDKDEEFFAFNIIEVYKAMFKLGYYKAAIKYRKDKTNDALFQTSYNTVKDLLSDVNEEGRYTSYSAELLNKIFDSLDKLSIPEKYTFDIYYYNKEFTIDKVSEEEQKEYELIPYVHTKDADKVFSPDIKVICMPKPIKYLHSFVELTDIKFDSSMIIKHPVYTEECRRIIPSPMKYVHYERNIYGVWQHFMFKRFIEKDFYPIIFSLESFKKDFPSLFAPNSKSKYYIDEEKLKHIDFRPKITNEILNNSIECFEYRSGKIISVSIDIPVYNNRLFSYRTRNYTVLIFETK